MDKSDSRAALLDPEPYGHTSVLFDESAESYTAHKNARHSSSNRWKYGHTASDIVLIQLGAIRRWCRTNINVTVRKKSIVIFLAILAALLILYRGFHVSNNRDNNSRPQDEHKDTRFGVVVDCGSTGTRAHVFTWTENPNLSGIPRIRVAQDRRTGKALTKHITPGLSTLASQPHKASDYMEPIMHFICDSVPKTRHQETPVYFMATAGLRLLDKSVQNAILADVTNDLKAKFHFPHIKSQVITGEHEGIYSWMSLNLNRIYNDSTSRSASTGMIEMGGASIQVAYEVTPDAEKAVLKGLVDDAATRTYQNEQVTVELSENRFVRLFVTTFLGLGWHSARESAIDLLIKEHLKKAPGNLGSGKLTLDDPCLATGSEESVVRSLRDLDLGLGSISTKPHRSGNVDVNLRGSGDFLNCVNLLERLLQASKSSKLNCSPHQDFCPMNLLGESFIPFKQQPFAGLSEMYYTSRDLVHESGPFNKYRMFSKAKRVCSTEYSILIQKNSHSGTRVPQDRLLHQCFRSVWLLTMLHSSGLKMPSNYDNFKPMEQINGREIDWTIGALVSELALSRHNSPRYEAGF